MRYDKVRELNGTCVPFEELQGKVLKEVSRRTDKEGYVEDTLLFVTEDGERYMQLHEQDCCENVTIEDICGDLKDLIGEPILMAYEATNKGQEGGCETFTWTFYNLSTVKGSVTIRWYGESNGFYSESVDFLKLGGE